MIEELEVYELDKNWHQKIVHKARNTWKKVLETLKLKEEEKIRNKLALETYAEVEEKK